MYKTVLITLLALLLAGAATAGEVPGEKIRWMDFSQGQARSRQTDKPLILYFYSDSCPSCGQMDKSTWQDSRIIEALNNRYVAVKVDVKAQKQIAAMYKVYYLPTTWFIKPDGKPFGNRSGYMPPEMFLKILAYLPQ